MLLNLLQPDNCPHSKNLNNRDSVEVVDSNSQTPIRDNLKQEAPTVTLKLLSASFTNKVSALTKILAFLPNFYKFGDIFYVIHEICILILSFDAIDFNIKCSYR